MATRFVNGQTIDETDFTQSSSGVGDAGKAVVLDDAQGKISGTMLKAGFGGTGADGALTIASGTTNIDLGGVQVFVRNYTSISITGTGALTFTNPHANGTTIILKSQGNVTLTSSATPIINCSSLGSSALNVGYGLEIYQSNNGLSGGVSSGGAGGALPTFNTTNAIRNIISQKYIKNIPGAGGGGATNSCAGSGGGGSFITAGSSGGGGNGAITSGGGLGGRGGGVLLIECAGALNFTTASGISVAGGNGANGTNAGGSFHSGGGGGGGGGVCFIFYNTLTSSSGTISVAGGAGGTAFGSGGAGGAGGAGYSLVALNTEFV